MTTARHFQADVPVQSSRPRRERQRLIRLTAALAPLLVLSLTAGCATTGRPGEIPLGQWSGQGTFTYEHWPSGEGEDDQDDKVIERMASGFCDRRQLVLKIGYASCTVGTCAEKRAFLRKSAK